jgi:hypothetical protein
MTEHADHVLAAIDGAIADWETSDDAVRWVPEDDRTDELRPDEPTSLRPGSAGTLVASAGWCAPVSHRYELLDGISEERPELLPRIRASRGDIRYPEIAVVRVTELDEAGQPTGETRIVYGIDPAAPVDRWRGPTSDFAWADEIAAWQCPSPPTKII